MMTSISQRNNYLTFIMLLAGLFFAGIVTAEIQKFDMGSDQSLVWPGFTRVTEKNVYSPENHYGWMKEAGSALVHRQSWRYIDGLPDALTCDAVAPGKGGCYYRGKMEFMLDLTNGEYGVYMYLGDYLGGKYESDIWEDYSVSAEGQVVASMPGVPVPGEKWNEKVFYNMDGDYHKGDDIWKKYIAPRFVPDRFNVKVTDGQLNLVFSNTPVCCLVVYPLAESQPALAFIDDLEKKRRASFENGMKDETPRPQEQMSDVTDAERERGYLWYAANYLDDIYPFDLPPRERESNELKIFASLGEFEPASFVVRPLRDLQQCELEIGDLKSENGAMIKADCWDIRAVRYLECPKANLAHTYIIRPAMLVKRGRFDMEEGINRQCWLTLRVPGDAQPGKYSGMATFRAQNASSVSIPVKVRVLPFHLRPLEDSGRYQIVYWPEMPDNMWKMDWSETIRDQRDHGMNLLHFWYPVSARLADGKVEINLTNRNFNIETILNRYRTNGYPMKLIVWNQFDQVVDKLVKEPPCDPEYLEEYQKRLGKGQFPDLKKTFSKEFESIYKQMASAIASHFKSNGWPEIYFYSAGEGGSRGEWGIWKETQYLKFQKEAGLKGTTSTVGLKALDSELPYMYAVNWSLSQVLGENTAAFEKIKAAGVRLWIYGCYGWQIRTTDEQRKYGHAYPSYDRLLRGFWFWKCGAEGTATEHYCRPMGAPYDEFDGDSLNFGIVFPSPQGPVPTPTWERIREGIDDSKYCAHLSLMITEAEKSKDKDVRQAAEKAKAVLDQVMSELPLDAAQFKTGSRPDNKTYDLWRWQIGDQIVKLQDIMKIK